MRSECHDDGDIQLPDNIDWVDVNGGDGNQYPLDDRNHAVVPPSHGNANALSSSETKGICVGSCRRSRGS